MKRHSVQFDVNKMRNIPKKQQRGRVVKRTLINDRHGHGLKVTLAILLRL